jgi:hypothetical protein
VKKGFFVGILVLILILLVSNTYAVEKASTLGVSNNNIARIVDLNNDGLKDILAFLN